MNRFPAVNLGERILLSAVVAALTIALAILPAWPQEAKRSGKSAPVAAAGEFFIISSVDLGKKELLLKRPTEVTELMRVDDQSRYFDNDGKAVQLGDLRAGDTVYVATRNSAKSTPAMPAMAATIRKGPMTLDELHRRYLKTAR